MLLNRPGQEKRLATIHERFRRAEPKAGSARVWKQVRAIGGTGVLIVLGAVIGGGAFLFLDSSRPPSAERQFSLRDAYYNTCREAFQDGRANIRRGEPGYRPELDADGDGLACEPYIPR